MTKPISSNSTAAYEEMAWELIYSECVKAFRYNDTVRSADSALGACEPPDLFWIFIGAGVMIGVVHLGKSIRKYFFKSV